MKNLITLLLLVAVAGCGTPAVPDFGTVSGRRVQNASIVANTSVPYRLGAYELVFADGAPAGRQPRRAALLVDLAGANGQARGFVEWGRAGEAPAVYVGNGWARQRDADGQRFTVFELALEHLDAPRPPGVIPERLEPAPRAVRVVVNEASGDVTLTRRP
jgi:hypothetical protein